ncbi:hypothetical protein NVP1176O_44 [Vibrio phage 1.176.O._10N.261.55.F5]|nr:hypothetical protein NVP1176O_44 [Vibrio phage 1.176.O._10N.261.55.F5]
MRDYIKVKFADDFRQQWIAGFASIDGDSEDLTEAAYLHGDYAESFKELTDRVSGQIGFVYHDDGNDYFEQVDDNWSIPETCFEFLD